MTASEPLAVMHHKYILYIVNSRFMAKDSFSQLRQPQTKSIFRCNISRIYCRVHKKDDGCQPCWLLAGQQSVLQMPSVPGELPLDCSRQLTQLD